MLKGQDIVVLLEIAASSGDAWTVRSVGAKAGLDAASVHRALRRLDEAGLVDLRRKQVVRARAEEFLVHAVKYVFPPKRGSLGRGIPTAWGARPLIDEFAPTDEPPPVWPDPHGTVRGEILEPLHASVPAIARADPRLAEGFALIDALRLGDARARELARPRMGAWLDAAGAT